jgi:hypothetical protein
MATIFSLLIAFGLVALTLVGLGYWLCWPAKALVHSLLFCACFGLVFLYGCLVAAMNFPTPDGRPGETFQSAESSMQEVRRFDAPGRMMVPSRFRKSRALVSTLFWSAGLYGCFVLTWTGFRFVWLRAVRSTSRSA